MNDELNASSSPSIVPRSALKVVQGVGFEPTYGFRRPGLQPGAINHSTTPACVKLWTEPAKGLEPPTL